MAGSIPTTTTITLDDPDPSTVGQAVTVHFTVTGGGVPAGNVTVTDSGGAPSCSATVAAGSCSITLTTTGLHTLTASYAGDVSHLPSSDTEDHSVSVIIAVNTFADEIDANGNCSLREAIRASNLDTAVDACPAGSPTIRDVITLATGTYVLTLAGSDDTAAGGDLDITGDLRVTGAGAASTFIRQNTVDRVLDVLSGTVVFESLTVRLGRHAIGAGIRNQAFLTLNSVTVTENVARTSGGGSSIGAGIFTTGTLTLNNSTVSNNIAGTGPEGTSRGAGIHNSAGTVTLNSSTVTGNQAVSGVYGTSQGGGIYTLGGSTTLNSTTPSGNTVTAGAGGTAQGPNTYP
jgi:CSLREA domain-containing protein